MARSPDPELIERRRRQILDAALQCFRRRGFHQASMQEICAEAQMSAGAVYRYFRSKTDIIIAIAEDERAEAAALISQHCDGSAFAALQSLCAESIRRAEAVGARLIADVLAEASRNPELAQRLSETERRFRPQVADLIRLGVERGEFAASQDADQLAGIIETYFDGLILGSVIPGALGRHPIEDVRVLLTSLLKPRSPPESAPPGRAPTRARAHTPETAS